jgi:two-component sensor histidine kinase
MNSVDYGFLGMNKEKIKIKLLKVMINKIQIK